MSSLEHDGRVFSFREPLKIDVTRDRGWYVREASPFAMLAWGRTEQDADEMFAREFAALWDYATDRALRRVLVDFVTSVAPSVSSAS